MFEGWDNFYLMLGPAAVGLIGLLFVVVTLTAGFDRSKAIRGQALYLTPTALHFGMVMVISAIAMAPRLGPAATAAVSARDTLRVSQSRLGLHGKSPMAVAVGS